MKVKCVWEHNRNDTLLYAIDFPGAYPRGKSIDVAISKMKNEISSYLQWIGETTSILENVDIEIFQDKPSNLNVADADSDVIFESERISLTAEEYHALKTQVLKSAEDFISLFGSIPNKDLVSSPIRKTFYGIVPRSAKEMYEHTKNVNEYYFGEIDVEADNTGNIYECRKRGFEALEAKPNFLQNHVNEGSYGEEWSLRKVIRRFIWHDRIHARAMYRMAVKEFGAENIQNPFCF